MELLYTLLLLACACSLSGVLERPEPFIAELVCRACEYARDGLSADAPCPECGTNATLEIKVDRAVLRRAFVPKLAGCMVASLMLSIAIATSRDVSIAMENSWRAVLRSGEPAFRSYASGCCPPSPVVIVGPMLPALLALAIMPVAFGNCLRVSLTHASLLLGAGCLFSLTLSAFAALT